MQAYINSIATAVPPHDIHSKFVSYAPRLIDNNHAQKLFARMSERSQIEHRYSFLDPHIDLGTLDKQKFYQSGNFPDTAERMRFYQDHAFILAKSALDKLNLPRYKDQITHIIVTTCTGFYAPGLDIDIVNHYGLKKGVERTVIGFMGCYAAINALKLSHHIVQSKKNARVLILNLELCTLHLKEDGNLEQILSFLIFADGCSASLVSADREGLEIKSFYAAILPASHEQITWKIGPQGFDMILSGEVPKTIAASMPGELKSILGGRNPEEITLWAIHPGGRSVLDAVEKSANLPQGSLNISRDVLRRYGNMSSATVMFVLNEMMDARVPAGLGCAIAFGPGVTVESMMFSKLAG